MELEVWSGDWGLPSVEPNCLAVLAYCKFSNVPITVKATNNPWKSPNGDLPVLQHDGVYQTKVSSIFNYLREQNYGCEFDLSAGQSADMLAFLALVEEKLIPAVCHLWWVDGKTYSELTRPWFAKAVKFPFNFYYPGRKQSEYTTRIYQAHQNLSEEDVDIKIYRDAKECLTLLSTKLATSDFFFGKRPTALDAVVYGYLAPLLKAPLQANSLAGHVKACDNLQSLITRIQLHYFAAESRENTSHQGGNKSQQDGVEEYPNKHRNMMVAGMVATSAMVGYAVMSGMVQIELTGDDGDEETASKLTEEESKEA